MSERKRNTQTQSTVFDKAKSQDVFLLKKISESPNTIEILVDFSAYNNSKNSSHQISSTYSSVPVFNKDKRHYTQSFILSEDIAKLNQSANICLENHIRKTRQLEQEKQEMLLPKPSKSASFCQICREPFDEYLTHINRPSHLQKMRASQFYKDISDLCQKINPHLKVVKQKKIKKERKKKQSTLPSLKKKNSNGKINDSLSTGLQSPQCSQMAAQ